MSKTIQKISLAPTRDIPFNSLVLSQANVRTIKTGVSIDELSARPDQGRAGETRGAPRASAWARRPARTSRARWRAG
jgi:hypothetical protein